MLKLVHWLRDNYYGEVDQEMAMSKLLNINSIDAYTSMFTLRNIDHESTETFGTIPK